MIPCKLCGPNDEWGNIRRGLKQVGKTRYFGDRYERHYRCQDCGAICHMTGDTTSGFHDEWERPGGDHKQRRVTIARSPDVVQFTPTEDGHR